VLIPAQLQIYDRLKQKFKKQFSIEDELLDFNKPNEAMLNICKKEGIETLDLLPKFKEYSENNNEKLYFEIDGHWNRNGHLLAAECIYEKIVFDMRLFDETL
jgi:hypothetical protein